MPMRRRQIKSVAAMFLALHGLMAVAGNSGLHVITGCSHQEDAVPCSHSHGVACIGGGRDCHESDHCSASAAHSASGTCDGHDCPICQWWLANGRFIAETGPVECVEQVLIAGPIGDSRILLPSSDLRECFPRGPPAISIIA
jgi:hypothetical protein